MHHRPNRRLPLLGLGLLLAATLAACGGGVDAEEDDHDHEHTVIETAGRLVSAEAGSKTLRIHDLDSATGTVTASVTADSTVTALYASPGGRYAVAMQRTGDLVQFVDGGVWQEDHGDHLHDYRQAPALLAWKITGPRPTHFDRQAGKQAAIFMDGNSAASPVQNASVRLITDASIASASEAASLNLSVPIHGLAEPVDNKLLVVHRAADAPDTLPTHLTLFQRSGSGFTETRRLDTRCNGMHGSFSSGDFTVTGCTDGMLVVRHTGTATVSDLKVPTAVRVGTVAGHPRLPGHFIGYGNEGVAPAPVTTRFFALDAQSGTASAWAPQGWSSGRVVRALSFDRTGQRVFLLDDQGTLVVAQRQGGAWAPLVRAAAVIPAMPSAAPWPAFATNEARDEIYLTDPAARQLVVINSSTGAVTARRDLGFVPSYLTWTGIAR